MTLYSGKTLDELEALANAATEGPWIVAHHCEGHRADLGCCAAECEIRYVNSPQGSMGNISTVYNGVASHVEAHFIAASRTAIPGLIAHIRKLERQLDNADSLLERYMTGKLPGGGENPT